MARFKTNNPQGTPLYASNHVDHVIKYLKYGTEVFGTTPVVKGPNGRGSIRQVTEVNDSGSFGWVFTSELSNP